GLAYARQVQEVFRPNLKLLLMSATLETARISKMLRDATLVRSEGRQSPVETRFLPRTPAARIEALAADAVRQALRDDTGDILVFLPGVGEIRRTQSLLESDDDIARAVVVPLYGNLSLVEQEAAILPDPAGRRKIVLATDIAESSL